MGTSMWDWTPVWILDTNVGLLDAGLQDERSSVGDGKVALMKT